MLKVPKINVSEVDLNYFNPKDFSIDEYWMDLYNPEQDVKNTKN